MSTARLSYAAAVLAMLTGLLALLGWALGTPVFYTTIPGLPAMTQVTAMGVVLIGAGLLLSGGDLQPSRRNIARVCAFAVLAGVAVVQFALVGKYAPSPATSIVLALLGIALLLLQASRPPVLALGALSVFALTLPLCRLTELLLTLGNDRHVAAGFFATTSLNSALALCLLAGPALFLHPRLPFGRILFSSDPFTQLIRMIMPLGVVVPVVLAVLIEFVVEHESKHTHFAVIAALGLLSALYTALIWRGYEKLQSTTAALQEREKTTRSIMDSLPHAIAVTDKNGQIVNVNDTWREFAALNGADQATSIGNGINYLDSCRKAEGDACAAQALAGIKDVLAQRHDAFAFEYPCHSPEQQRWFLMRANHLRDAHEGLVISHIDVTQRKLAELRTQRDREQQFTLRQMLETVLHGDSLEETLGQCLDQLLAVPWLAILPHGGIHLMAADGEHLELTVARNLPAEVRCSCRHLPLNRCLCGKAAACGQTVFASNVDLRHEVTYPDMEDHGHYCVPMFGLDKQVIGVLVLYVEPGSRPDKEREQFLESAADILASFVLRKRGDDALQNARAALERQQLRLADEVRERTAELVTSEARTRAVLHTMADGVVQIDAAGTILLTNFAVGTMFGYEPEELAGQNVNILMPEPDRSCHDGYLHHYQQTRQAKIVGRQLEVRGRRKDGSTFPLELAVNELVDDAGITFIGVMRDLTLHHEMRRAQQVALEESQRLTNMKSAFLANMSHEIRTPLSAVMGFARISMRENEGRSSQASSVRILEAGEHLLEVINDILDFSKIEAGKLKIEMRPFSLAAVLEASLTYVAEAAKGKGIEVSLTTAEDLPSWVTGDSLRIKQILINLLSNAVKFTQRGQVTLTADRLEGDQLRFSVEDTGIGMTAEQLSRLFDAFEQADSSTSREYGGTGLGLAISRRLAQLMDGSITVDSTPGLGSIFTLTLPLAEALPQPGSAHVQLPGGRRLAGLRFLVADDVETNRLIIDDLLRQEGAQAEYAVNGRDALELLAQRGNEAFDVVLMDVQMPVLDGLDATGEIRKCAPQLPVIGLTAHALADERDRCLAAGMVDHVTKPVDSDALVAAILRHATPTGATQSVAMAAASIVRKPSSESQLVDWAALRSRFNRNERFLHRLASSAMPSLNEADKKLAAGIAQNDYQPLIFAAHTLRGLAGNLFAQRVVDLAKATDNAARREQPEAFALARQLICLLDTLRGELSAFSGATDGAD